MSGRRLRARRALRRALHWSGLMVAVGCADFPSETDPAFGLPDVAVVEPSFAADVQPIFTKRCSQGGCHSLATRQAGLSLATGASYDDLVDVTSVLAPTFVRVRPGEPGQSWLVYMIGPDDVARGGHPRMPLAAPPLTPNQITTIVNWIERGAEEN